MNKLETFFTKAISENPASVIMTGDFNCRSPLLWKDENMEKREGRILAEFCTQNNVEQMIESATHFPRENIETCIDLILTNQPFYMVDKGVLPSPDASLKHQIIYGKINFSIPSPPPYKRKIWDYKNANIQAIKTVMSLIPWDLVFYNKCPTVMVQIFQSTF